jgi:hypothetical protein
MSKLPTVPLPWLIGGAIVGYLLIMFTNPVRPSLRDGLRCIRRYSVLWVTLGVFGFAYALFQLGLRFYFYHALPPDDRPSLVWAREAWRDPDLWLTGSPQSVWYLPPHAIKHAVFENALPALENVAGIFNLLVATFPLSAFAAFLFFTNWENHHTVLLRSLRKRFGKWGWALYAGILICGFAALAKPLLYVMPLVLGPGVAATWFQWAPVAEWLSFLFEYLAGVCVQLGLILVAYCWVRGISFTHEHLIDFAIRRFSFVVRWSLVVMLLSSLLIHAPLILKNFPLFQSIISPEEALVDRWWHVARAMLTGVLLLFATMQITLTFHSESLAKAFHDHRQFVMRNWWPLLWFLIVTGVHFYLLQVAVSLVQLGLGEGTALGVAWSLLVPWIKGLVGAWLLASWVCFYRHSDVARAPQPEGALEQGVLF